MTGRRVYFWNVDSDVVDGPGEGDIPQDYRTIIATSRTAPRPRSVVLCAAVDLNQRTREIAAVDRVHRKRAVSTGRTAVRVDPFVILRDPVHLDSLSSDFDHHITRALDEAATTDRLSPKEFTSRSSAALLDAICRASPEAESLLPKLRQKPARIAGLDGMRLREERDAVNTSLELAGISMPGEMLPERMIPIEDGEAFGASIHPDFIADHEDDLIAADLRRFDGQASLRSITGSASVVTDGDVRLTVMNVNRRRLEHVHGVDLVYYDHIKDQATAVQYKRLERVNIGQDGATHYDWVYRRRAELEEQLKLMPQQNRVEAITSADWRLSPSPTFFKFVRAEDFDPDGTSLLRGMYVPADYLRLGIRDGSFNTGRRGGFRIGYDSARYLTCGAFVELVRRGWIGTSKTDKSSLASMIAEMANVHEVVLAIRDQADRSP